MKYVAVHDRFGHGVHDFLLVREICIFQISVIIVGLEVHVKGPEHGNICSRVYSDGY